MTIGPATICTSIEGAEMGDDGLKTVMLDMDARQGGRRPTMAQVLDSARRMKAGLDVSDEDRAAVARFHEVAKKFVGAINAFDPDRLARMKSTVLSVGSRIDQVLSSMPTIGTAVAPLLAAMEEMPHRLEAAVAAMAKHGWYVDPDQGLDDLETLQTLIDAGNTSKVDELMMAHLETRLDAIEEALVAELPKREKILRSAFAAHRRGDYELSIPVLLIQADGACVDLTNHHFFLKARNTHVPEVAVHLEAISSTEDALFLRPISLELPISASEKTRERIAAERNWTSWEELNRHQVLHGESIDYGSRLNSLKAISLLNYLVSFLPIVSASDAAE